ncbi:ATP-binding cassette domain-containing protein [Tumebacillus algifaecis]|nr:ATP-binding cassette domain-containing protein [Tumebacillus algifaecis]
MKIQVDGLQFGTGYNGVLGPRGVGKTRLLKKMAQVEEGTNGQTCYVSRAMDSFHELTIKEYLCYMAGTKAIPREDVTRKVNDSIELMYLNRWADRTIGELSTLMKSKALVAKALLSDSQVLLLDEVLAELSEQERMMIGYALGEAAKERVVVVASNLGDSLEGLLDTLCLLHPEKEAAHVSANTAYSWVEGKVWEYVAPKLPQAAEGRIVTAVKMLEDGVYVREIADFVPYEEVSQVTPTLTDAYLWWAGQR